jgi:hypothetical protein
VAISAGTRYAIVAYSATFSDNPYKWWHGLGDTYANGESFETSSSPPGTWLPFFNDFAFKTYVVTDSTPPLPTTKDQCKKGGWMDFGVFKNQGDCVSFVASGGENPPADG